MTEKIHWFRGQEGFETFFAKSEPNNSIFRNRKEALIKMKDYVTIVQRLLDEQIAKENEVEK